MITITCWFTFCDSWAASPGVIGCCAAFWAAGAAVAAAAATDCPAIKAGTATAATTREMVLLLACARSARPAMRPRMIASSRGRPGRPRGEWVPSIVARTRRGLDDRPDASTTALPQNFVADNFSITKWLLYVCISFNEIVSCSPEARRRPSYCHNLRPGGQATTLPPSATPCASTRKITSCPADHITGPGTPEPG